jgi:hypothetical protein
MTRQLATFGALSCASLSILLLFVYIWMSDPVMSYGAAVLPLVGFFTGIFGLASGLILCEVTSKKPWWWIAGMIANALIVLGVLLVIAFLVLGVL